MIIRSQILTTGNIKIKVCLGCHAKWSGSDVTTFLIYLPPISCTLKLEVAGSSEMLVHSRIYQTTCHHITGDSDLNSGDQSRNNGRKLYRGVEL